MTEIVVGNNIPKTHANKYCVKNRSYHQCWVVYTRFLLSCWRYEARECREEPSTRGSLLLAIVRCAGHINERPGEWLNVSDKGVDFPYRYLGFMSPRSGNTWSALQAMCAPLTNQRQSLPDIVPLSHCQIDHSIGLLFTHLLHAFNIKR